MVFEVVSSSLPSCKVANTSGREVDGREGEKERRMGGREGMKVERGRKGKKVERGRFEEGVGEGEEFCEKLKNLDAVIVSTIQDYKPTHNTLFS